MDDVVTVKAAHHVDYGINLADMAEELVAQTFTMAGAFYQAGYIHKFYCCRCVFFRIVHFGQLIQPFVRHGNYAHIGFDGAERKVGAGGAGVGYGVKKGAFAHIWQTHNT